MHLCGNQCQIFLPERTVSAADFKNFHTILDSALFIDPWEPSLGILGIQTVEIDPCGNIGGILILIFQTVFHACQMDQVQHLAPVYMALLLDGGGGILDRLFYQLHLFDAVPDQFELDIQRVQHKVVI